MQEKIKRKKKYANFLCRLKIEALVKKIKLKYVVA